MADTEEIASEIEIQTSSDVASTSTNRNKRPSEEDTSKEDGEEYYPPPPKRFIASSTSSHYKWNLSDDMKKYVLEQFHTYIPDTDLEDSILTKSPVPRNFTGPAPLR